MDILPYSRNPGVSRLLFSWSLTSYAASIVFVIVVGSFIGKSFENTFKDFNLKLPALTQAVVGFSVFLRESWIWVVLIPLPLVIGMLGGRFVAAGSDPESQRIRHRLLRTLLVLLAAAVALTYILAFFLPMISLVEGLSGASGKAP